MPVDATSMLDPQQPTDRAPIKARSGSRKPSRSESSLLSVLSASSAPLSRSNASQTSTGAGADSLKRHRPRFHHGSNRIPKRKQKSMLSLSPLERLPGELLDLIFLHSHEPSLPQCSSRIGARLSSRHVLLEYSLRTLELSPAPSEQQVEKKETKEKNKSLPNSVFGLTSLSVSSSKRPVEEWKKNQLLSLRFFTWEFFGAVLSIARRRYAPVNSENSMFLNCTIPSKLLHGPWTPSKVKFLEFLRSRCGCLPDPNNFTICDTANEGVQDAIRERAFDPLLVLLSSMLVEETHFCGSRTGFHSLPLIQPTMDMIHTAVFDHDCPIGIVCLLLIHGIRAKDIDFLDAPLWIWTERSGEKGVWVHWLLKNLWRMKDAATIGKHAGGNRIRRIRTTYPDVLRLDGMADFEPENIVEVARNELLRVIIEVCSHSHNPLV
jgi:hypothetical protein